MQMLTKKGLPDRRFKEFATPELTAKRVACAKAAGRTKLARKSAIKRLQSAAPDLLAALERCCSYLADLNGSVWIDGDDCGSVDMRQRAIALQSVAFSAITTAKGE